MKILIADDNTDNLYYLEVMLKGAGHEVISARNGREALDRLSGTRCDLIISDILMPAMDGFQLCRECRKREDLGAIPFIFYTATYTDEKDRKLGLGIGADEYLIKPMEPDKLLGAIDRVLAAAVGRRGEAFADEEDYLTEHNRRLIAKLEKKMAALEESTRELEREVVERRQAEDLIRESEERFRTIFDTVSDAIFLQDIDTGLIVEMNRVTCDMFGYDRGELKSLSLEGLCSQAGEPQFFEWKIRDREGRMLWVEILMKPVRLGTADRMLVVIRDIQARKTAEEALNNERLKLRILSDNAPFGMVLIDNKGRYTYMNSRFRDMFGYDLSDIPDGRTWFRRAYPDDRMRSAACRGERGSSRSSPPPVPTARRRWSISSP